MAYSSITKPSDYFNTILWTGDGNTTRSFTGVGFAPDWVWTKSRNNAANHLTQDIVRGANEMLIISTNIAEVNQPNHGYITSFDSDGYSWTEGSAGRDNFNASTWTYAGWNWLAGGTAVTNTDGAITSQVSANNTSGFSIITWTGDGTGPTVGTGLSGSETLGFATVKKRSTTSEWQVGGGYDPTPRNFAYHLELDSTAAISGAGPYMMGTQTTGNPSLLKLATEGWASGVDYVAYVFKPVKGFSRFGTYTGNASTDGTFVYTGFKPAWIMVKRTDSTNNWLVFDNKRDIDNSVSQWLLADTSNAEPGTGTAYVDFLSNGVKFRIGSADVNGSGATYFYMAFAENPFVGNDSGTGIPATAR